MGRHRALDKDAPTATDLLAQIAEEDARPPEPTSFSVEVVPDDEVPTDWLPRLDGVVPIRVRWISDEEAASQVGAASLLPTVEIPRVRPEPTMVEMAVLPPVPPPTSQRLQERRDGLPRPGGARRATEPS